MIDRASSFLNCPRCGLSIRPKVSWLTVEYCPRCMARARTPVKLFSSTLPAAELYPEGSVPTAGHQGVTTTITARSR
jgi:hypothetical protein